MTAARAASLQKFLFAFITMGLLLIGASWLITGVAPPALNLAPFALLFVAWQGLRASAAEGKNDAR